MSLLDDLEAAERAARPGGEWAPNGLRDAMNADGYSDQDAAFADLACRMAPALLRVVRAAAIVNMPPPREANGAWVDLVAALAALEGE